MPFDPNIRSAVAFGILTLMAARFCWLAVRQWRRHRTRYQAALVVFTGTLTLYVADRLLIRWSMLPKQGWLSPSSWITEATLWAFTIGLGGAVIEQEISLGWRPRLVVWIARRR